MSIAMDIVNGIICEQCMFPFQEEHGFPCLCTDCGGTTERYDPDAEQEDNLIAKMAGLD